MCIKDTQRPETLRALSNHVFQVTPVQDAPQPWLCTRTASILWASNLVRQIETRAQKEKKKQG